MGDPRPRAVEVRGSVDGEHPPAASRTGARRTPGAPSRRKRARGLLEIETARHQHQDVGARGDYIGPRRVSRRCSRETEDVDASGDSHHLGHPVAADHDRVGPLDAHGTRRRLGRRQSAQRLRCFGASRQRPECRRRRSPSPRPPPPPRRRCPRVSAAPGTGSGRSPGRRRTARCTSPYATAQTSHSSWVTMRSGRRSRSSRSSSR